MVLSEALQTTAIDTVSEFLHAEALPTTAIDTVSEFTRRSATGNCK